MSDYKEIKGTGIENLSADPPNPVKGQVWYRTDLGTFKTQKESALGAWSTSDPLSSPKALVGSAGTQTAALAFGGLSDAIPNNEISETEAYNGSAWTTVNSLNTGRRGPTSAGTQTSAILIGGAAVPPQPDVFRSDLTEQYDGTSWTTSVNTPSPTRFGSATATSNTAVLWFGADSRPVFDEYTTNAFTFDGTSWTATNAMNRSMNRRTEFGTQTAAIAYGGEPNDAFVESWNGTNWTSLSNFPSSIYSPSPEYKKLGGGSGTSTAGIVFQGDDGSSNGSNKSAFFDGSSWTIAPYTLGSGWYVGRSSAGTQTAALCIGGRTPPSIPGDQTDQVEQFNVPGFVSETITLE